MKKLLKIDSILFYVEDLEISAEFYEKELGLKKVWSDTDSKMIGFLPSENNSEIVIHNDRSLPNPSFSFSVEDVVQFCQEHKKAGFKVLVEPFNVRTGKFAVVADLDGNAIPIIDLTQFGGKPRYD